VEQREVVERELRGLVRRLSGFHSCKSVREARGIKQEFLRQAPQIDDHKLGAILPCHAIPETRRIGELPYCGHLVVNEWRRVPSQHALGLGIVRLRIPKGGGG